MTYDRRRSRLVAVTQDEASPSATDVWELPSNRPPRVAAAFSPSSPAVNERVTLSAQFADQDGDSASYRWIQTFGPAVALDNPTGVSATFATSIATSYGFELAASDGRDGYAYALGTVTVSPSANVNRDPVADAGSAILVNIGAQVTLSGLASSDPDGDTLSFSRRITSRPASSTVSSTAPAPNDSAGAGTSQFTPDRAGSYIVSLTVSDGQGGSSTDHLTVTVNTPPVVTAGSDRTIGPNTAVTLSAAGSDADADPLFYSWTQTAGPSLSIPNPDVASITVIAPSPGAYNFRVTATDGRGGSASASVGVMVEAPRLPDLVALSVSAAAARVEQNGSLTVTASVGNSGQTTAPGSVSAIVLSRDRLIGAGDQALGSVPVGPLAPSQSAPLTGTFAVPASVAPASYFLGLVADSTGVVQELSESNNTTASAGSFAVASATVRAANLVVRSVLTQSTVRAGDVFQASATLENSGNLDITPTFALEFFLSRDGTLDISDTAAGSDAVSGLAAGAQTQRSLQLRAPEVLAPAAYRLLARVDGANAVSESSESDNVAASAQPLQVTSRPGDATPPTASLSFHPTQTLTRPAVLTITATFDEPLVERPEIRLASSSGQFVTSLMTQVSGTAYRFQRAFSAADNGTYTISLRALDAARNALVTQPANNILAVQVALNSPPIASAGSDRVAGPGDTVRLSGSGSDPDGDRVSYRWSSSPPVALVNLDGPTPSFSTLATGRFLFVLTVSDGRGASTTDAVEVTITQVTRQTTEFLQVSGAVRLESGEPPASGTRLLLRNPRLSTVQVALPDPETGIYTVTFEAVNDAARSGDTLELTLENPDGTTRRIVQPTPPAFFLTDDHIAFSAVTGLQVIGEGSSATGGVLVTLAGAGTAGFGGDTNRAVSALLNSPSDIAFDATGHL